MFILNFFLWVFLTLILSVIFTFGAEKLNILQNDNSDDKKFVVIVLVSAVIAFGSVFAVVKETYEPFELFEKFKDEVKTVLNPKELDPEIKIRIIEQQIQDMKKMLEFQKNQVSDKVKKEQQKMMSDNMEKIMKPKLQDMQAEVDRMKKEVEEQKKKKAEATKIGKK